MEGAALRGAASIPGRAGAEKLEPRGQVVFIGGSLKVQRRRLMVLSNVLEHPSGERTFACLFERHGRLDRAAAREGADGPLGGL